MLIDSDVLVWLTRGHPGAAERLRQLTPWRISAVTYIELAQGCRNKAELERLKKGLAQRGTQIVPVTEAISERAMRLIDQHALGDGLQLGDALIGATALELGLTLITANVKHFGPMASLTIERFDPAAGVQ
jgi:predicted nucleic acid-binding protein